MNASTIATPSFVSPAKLLEGDTWKSISAWNHESWRERYHLASEPPPSPVVGATVRITFFGARPRISESWWVKVQSIDESSFDGELIRARDRGIELTAGARVRFSRHHIAEIEAVCPTRKSVAPEWATVLELAWPATERKVKQRFREISLEYQFDERGGSAESRKIEAAYSEALTHFAAEEGRLL